MQSEPPLPSSSSTLGASTVAVASTQSTLPVLELADLGLKLARVPVNPLQTREVGVEDRGDLGNRVIGLRCIRRRV